MTSHICNNIQTWISKYIQLSTNKSLFLQKRRSCLLILLLLSTPIFQFGTTRVDAIVQKLDNIKTSGKKDILVPISFPVFLQEPQNVPRAVTRTFTLEQGAILKVNLTIAIDIDEKKKEQLWNGGRDRVFMGITENGIANMDSSGIYRGVKNDIMGHPRQENISFPFSNLFDFISQKIISLYGDDPETRVVPELGAAENKMRHTYIIQETSCPKLKDRESVLLLSDSLCYETVEVSKPIDSKDEIIKPTVIEDVYFYIMDADQLDRFRNVHFDSHSLSDPTVTIWKTQLISFMKERVDHHLYLDVTVPYTGRFFMFIVQAKDVKGKVNFNGKISMINPGGFHLSMDQQYLEQFAFVLFAVHVVLLLFLLLTVFVFWRNDATGLHKLMALSLFCKVMYMGIDWFNIPNFAKTGSLSFMQRVIPDLIFKISEIAFLLMLLLLALGWKVYRTSISLLERRLCMGFCIFSFYLGVLNFQVPRYILHVIVYLCIVFAIQIDLAVVGTQLNEQGIAVSTGQSYKRFLGYIKYRTLFIVYILKPMILLFLKLFILERHNSLHDDSNEYLLIIVDAVIDLVIYMILVHAFQPFTPLRLFKVISPSESEE